MTASVIAWVISTPAASTCFVDMAVGPSRALVVDDVFRPASKDEGATFSDPLPPKALKSRVLRLEFVDALSLFRVGVGGKGRGLPSADGNLTASSTRALWGRITVSKKPPDTQRGIDARRDFRRRLARSTERVAEERATLGRFLHPDFFGTVRSRVGSRQ